MIKEGNLNGSGTQPIHQSPNRESLPLWVTLPWLLGPILPPSPFSHACLTDTLPFLAHSCLHSSAHPPPLPNMAPPRATVSQPSLSQFLAQLPLACPLSSWTKSHSLLVMPEATNASPRPLLGASTYNYWISVPMWRFHSMHLLMGNSHQMGWGPTGPAVRGT